MRSALKDRFVDGLVVSVAPLTRRLMDPHSACGVPELSID
jgi:hypothetical protein